jgi:hypothetical protein
MTAALSVVLLGCGTSATDLTLGPTDTNVAGTFMLTSANGQPLPIIASITLTEQWNLTQDQLVLTADGNWTETTSYQIFNLSDGSERASDGVSSGTYTIDSKQINFLRTVGGSASFSGSLSGNVLSLLFEGGRFLYTR